MHLMWSHATAHWKPASFKSSKASRVSAEQNSGYYQVVTPQSLPKKGETPHRIYSYSSQIFKGKWQKTKQLRKKKAAREINNTNVAMLGIKGRLKQRHFGTLLTTLRTASANETKQQQP